MAATNWQHHSVRGFLAGVVRKKLGLNLVSEQTDKGRYCRSKVQIRKLWQRLKFRNAKAGYRPRAS
jgi:Protein of unknown function (DUF3489)